MKVMTTPSTNRQQQVTFSPFRRVRLFNVDDDYVKDIEEEIRESTEDVIESRQSYCFTRHGQSLVERRLSNDRSTGEKSSNVIQSSCTPAREENSEDTVNKRPTRKRKKATEAGPEKQTRNETKYYTVEKVLGHRFRNGQAEYLIKWKGYRSRENSWEPASNLDENLVTAIDTLIMKNK